MSEKSKSNSIAFYIKSFVLLILLGLVLFFTWFYGFYQKPKPDETLQLIKKMKESSAPLFTGKKLNGEIFNLEKIQNKILIIHFWATWCDPCIKEFPTILKIVDHFKDKIVLIAVSEDTNQEDVENFLTAFDGHKENVEIIIDQDFKIASMYGTVKLPESYILYKDFKLYKKIVGIDDWFNQAMIDLFTELLKMEEI